MPALRGINTTARLTSVTRIPHKQFSPLEERAAQYDHSDAEVDDKAGHVNERGDEGRGRSGRVEADAAQQQRQHRAGERAPEHYADERDADGHRHEEPVLAVDVREGRPDGDAQEAYDAEHRAEYEARKYFAPHHAPPVAQANLAERHRAYD